MNENPRISVIIPVYNAGEYLKECLQSVCRNQQRDLEIILIDDGSTDQSSFIAQKWADEDGRIRYVRQENQGVSAARNLGMEYARGRWIMFVDADDTIEPDTIEKFQELELQFSKAEIVCFGCRMDAAGDAMELRKLKRATAEELALLACGVRSPGCDFPESNYASVWLKLYRRDFLRRTNLKIDRELVRGEDLMFNCYAFSEASWIAFSSYNYYYYRNNPQSVTRRRNPAVKDRDVTFQKKLQAFADQNRFEKLEQIGASYSALNGIAVSFEAYFSFFSLSEYRDFRRELTAFLQQECYQKYLGRKWAGSEYLNRKSSALLFLLENKMYFLSWLLFGLGRSVKRRWKQKYMAKMEM